MGLPELRDNLHLLVKTNAFIESIKKNTIYIENPQLPVDETIATTEKAFSEFVAEIRKNVLDLISAHKKIEELNQKLDASEAKTNEMIALDFSRQLENEALVLENESLKLELRQLKGE